jgi:outer membrane protein OmpA-like peptidoglycan-associated protein
MMTAGVGAYAQNGKDLKATDADALVKVIVTNMQNKPSVGDIITLTSKESQTEYTGVTGDSGYFKIVVPNGDKYIVNFRSFAGEQRYKEIEIPKLDGTVEMNLMIKYDLPEVVVLENVTFETNKSTIRPSSFLMLDRVAELLKNKKNMVIEISGHTDDVGETAANQKLSEGRAMSVKKYLESKGARQDQITAVGYGKTKPIADNKTPAGKAKNRRIEIKILKQ